FEIRGARQIDQEPQRFSRDPVLAVVDVEVADGDGQLAAAIGILIEKLAQPGLADLFMMPAQGVPRRCGGDVGEGMHGGHWRRSSSSLRSASSSTRVILRPYGLRREGARSGEPGARPGSVTEPAPAQPQQQDRQVLTLGAEFAVAV